MEPRIILMWLISFSSFQSQMLPLRSKLILEVDSHIEPPLLPSIFFPFSFCVCNEEKHEKLDV